MRVTVMLAGQRVIAATGIREVVQKTLLSVSAGLRSGAGPQGNEPLQCKHVGTQPLLPSPPVRSRLDEAPVTTEVGQPHNHPLAG